MSLPKDWKITGCVIALFVGYRLWVIFTGRYLLDSDEAIFGLMTIHASRGELCAFYWGQDYLGSFQALVALPFTLLFGATPLTMRITAMVEGLVILILWKWILEKWNRPGVWVMFGLIFSIASEYLINGMLRSRGGIETLLLGSLIVWYATRYFTLQQPIYRASLEWFGFGLLIGISWWTSQFTLFFILPTVMMIFFKNNPCQFWEEIQTTDRESRRKWIGVLFLWILYGSTLFLLFARASVYHGSKISDCLFEYRGWLIFSHALMYFLILLTSRALKFSLWPLCLGGGVLIGYLPTLVVILTKEYLYNISNLQPLQDILVNLRSLLLLESGAITGLQDLKLISLGVPLLVGMGVTVLFAASVFWLFSQFIRILWKEKRFPVFEAFTGFVFLLVLFIIPLMENVTENVLRYTLSGVFFLHLMLAFLLSRLWQLHRGGAVLILIMLLGVNLNSNLKRPKAAVNGSSMVLQDDQQLIEFLLDRDIHFASTSLNSARYGYWVAYRLTFASKEQLIVYPVFHTSRIDRYRLLLQQADRCAIITQFPESVEGVFMENQVPYQIQRFGQLSVIWDFDKKRVDELGLISYERFIK